MCPIIQTNDLTKIYKDFHAVKDLSLTVNKGEIYGFIGLNGAGKTTTIRMLLGMIKPTHGTAYIGGRKVGSMNHSIWEDVGSMVETPQAYPELTVGENLEIFRRLRLIPNKHIVDRVMDQLNLTRYRHTKAGNLSLGNAQRLGIAKALLHSPDILILDEPVNGLDPSGIVEIRKLFQDLAYNHGVTILISSHLLSEVAIIATKIGIIHDGQLIQEIEADQLVHVLKRRLILDTHQNEFAIDILSSAGYTSSLNEDGFIQVFSEKAIEQPSEISRLLVYGGVPPTQLTVEKENLESYFLRVIQGEGNNIL